MTEEEKTEREACFAAIRETVQRLSRLMDTAYQQYSQLVEQVVKDRITGEQEIERIMEILSRRTKNNPCLVGEPGVGLRG